MLIQGSTCWAHDTQNVNKHQWHPQHGIQINRGDALNYRKSLRPDNRINGPREQQEVPCSEGQIPHRIPRRRGAKPTGRHPAQQLYPSTGRPSWLSALGIACPHWIDSHNSLAGLIIGFCDGRDRRREMAVFCCGGDCVSNLQLWGHNYIGRSLLPESICDSPNVNVLWKCSAWSIIKPKW